MPRLPFRIALFLSSYAPLFALLAWTNRSSERVWTTLVCVIGVSIILLLVVMVVCAYQKGPPIRVKQAIPDDGDVLAYVAVYLVPFLGLDLQKTDDLVIFLGFLGVLMTVYVNSNMLFVNPLLSLAGYHLYSLKDLDDNEYRLITRRRDIDPQIELRPFQASRYIRLEARWRLK